MIGMMVQNQKGKEGKTVQKGVGGFRPVVNWREISIHKKKIADKQILCCIILVGFLIIIIGILFLVLGLYVIKRQCPWEWTGIQDRCLYVSAHKATWPATRIFCQDQGGHMVDIKDEDENKELQDMIKMPTWIGLSRSPQESAFRWTTGLSFKYNNFARPPSSARRQFTECVQMDKLGNWQQEKNCSQELGAACEYQKSYFPFVLIGPIVIGCGVIFLLLSIEVCIRHRRTLRKEKGLLKEEVLPNEDEEPKKVDTHGILSDGFAVAKVTMWRPLSNKTSPESLSQTEKSPIPKATTSVVLEKEEPSPSTMSATVISSKDASLLDTNSQDQLELLLSPKNLR